MIDTRRRAAALAGALLLILAVRVQALEPGDQAPLGVVPGLELRAAPGKLLYVDFWASWCTSCRKSFPWMNALQQKYDASRFQVIGVNVDADHEDAQKFLAKVPAQFTIAWDPDGDAARAFGVKGMPTGVLIGADGKVLYRAVGFDQGEAAEIERLVAAAAGAGP